MHRIEHGNMQAEASSAIRSVTSWAVTTANAQLESRMLQLQAQAADEAEGNIALKSPNWTI
ncbi:hypothetical protein C5167_040389 [Papaver somniferum]|uniref:Uncharacterized protein n=1 Tax=Papaver somniferum TaxID=3469 RepID=A0A4Y7II76_PAPSO|nr:hypothetical protein C5167_040389 [Papaver somniferum]